MIVITVNLSGTHDVPFLELSPVQASFSLRTLDNPFHCPMGEETEAGRG